jgi:hypothetical protein
MGNYENPLLLSASEHCVISHTSGSSINLARGIEIGRPVIVGDGRKYSEQHRRRYSGPFPETDDRNRRSTDPLPRFFPHTQTPGYQVFAPRQDDILI